MIEILKYVKNYLFSLLKIYKNKKNINFNYELIKKIKINNIDIYKIRNCKFNVKSDFIFDLKNKIINETIDNKIRIKFFRKENFIKKIIFDDKTVLLNLSSEYHYNYYHFLIDTMFKLFVFKKLKIKNYKLILPLEKFNGFRKELLYFFFPNEKKSIILINNQTEIFGGLVYHIKSDFTHQFFTFKEYINFLRKKIFQNKNIKSLENKKIYISRKSVNYRNFVNETRLINFLKKKGFKIFKFENLSIIKQFELFKNANVIIACHGSALTNLIAADKAATIIELHSSFFSDHYTKISQLVGINKHKNYLLKENSFSIFFDYINEKNKNKTVNENFLNDIDLLLR